MGIGIVGCAVLEASQSAITGKVARIFEKSVHLEGNGVVITLGDLNLPNHPYSILCPDLPKGLREGQEFRILDRTIFIPGSYRLDFGKMDVYRPVLRVDSMAETREMLRALQAARHIVATASFRDGFHSFAVMGPLHGMMAQAVLPVLESVMEAIHTRDWDTMTESAVELAGVGQGLTPSGDDFLVGLIAALRFHRASGGPGPEAQQLDSLAAGVRDRTSVFSAQNIGSAARGWVSDIVSEWLTILHLGNSDGMAGATRRLLAYGHSSGVDTFAGMTTGLASVLGAAS